MGRDQHKARFIIDIIADWEDLDQELRSRVFQRLNIYAIVAAHGWPIAIAASSASTPNTICVLPQEFSRCSKTDSSNPSVEINEVVEGRPTDQRQPQQQLLLRPQLRLRLHAVAEGAADRSFPNFFFKLIFNLIIKLTGPLHLQCLEFFTWPYAQTLHCYLALKLKPEAFCQSGSRFSWASAILIFFC